MDKTMFTDLHRGDELSKVLDRSAITEVLYQLFRGIDRCDERLIRDCFHPDGVDDHGGIFKGTGAEYAAWCVARLTDRWDSTHHMVSNVMIEFDGDTAHVEAYTTAAHQRVDSDGQTLFMFGGREIDRFERRDGNWRIASRLIINDWSSYGPVGVHPTIESYVSGSQDRNGVTRHG